MAPANPLPLEQGETTLIDTEPVSQQELNAWRRGFTPQAEIWNGRLAMLGLSVGLGVLLLVRLAGG
ncbi:high light inducible protein [Cyanobium sp. N.Huapi 1H5]|uniref:high light inducible protein n=1 Tax=Cyanobium sp. N.Huapi 1H5 TaxID=2823719 RepID=UPI0020CE1F82|nr:high light inducible protein [Cyanobium sp. N.Huapi 1H5]MBM5821732.1 high light inducible protein [Cyanobacteria bacterium K_Offshore_surface_m2_011]MCP9838250.1 high light inducible protein [Cyanobium sp. N.Huapi 1H5]